MRWPELVGVGEELALVIVGEAFAFAVGIDEPLASAPALPVGPCFDTVELTPEVEARELPVSRSP